jgi:hypothetical protein
MPKGPRQSKNPVEKLVLQVSQLNNTVDSILDSAVKPGFADAIIALKTKRDEEHSKGPNQDKEAREVCKLLGTYPGLAKSILSALKSKISEYKALGVIDKYKS